MRLNASERTHLLHGDDAGDQAPPIVTRPGTIKVLMLAAIGLAAVGVVNMQSEQAGEQTIDLSLKRGTAASSSQTGSVVESLGPYASTNTEPTAAMLYPAAQLTADTVMANFLTIKKVCGVGVPPQMGLWSWCPPAALPLLQVALTVATGYEQLPDIEVGAGDGAAIVGSCEGLPLTETTNYIYGKVQLPMATEWDSHSGAICVAVRECGPSTNDDTGTPASPAVTFAVGAEFTIGSITSKGFAYSSTSSLTVTSTAGLWYKRDTPQTCSSSSSGTLTCTESNYPAAVGFDANFWLSATYGLEFGDWMEFELVGQLGFNYDGNIQTALTNFGEAFKKKPESEEKTCPTKPDEEWTVMLEASGSGAFKLSEVSPALGDMALASLTATLYMEQKFANPAMSNSKDYDLGLFTIEGTIDLDEMIAKPLHLDKLLGIGTEDNPMGSIAAGIYIRTVTKRSTCEQTEFDLAIMRDDGVGIISALHCDHVTGLKEALEVLPAPLNEICDYANGFNFHISVTTEGEKKGTDWCFTKASDNKKVFCGSDLPIGKAGWPCSLNSECQGTLKCGITCMEPIKDGTLCASGGCQACESSKEGDTFKDCFGAATYNGNVHYVTNTCETRCGPKRDCKEQATLLLSWESPNAAYLCCDGLSYWEGALLHYCGTAPTAAPTPAPTCGGQNHFLAAWASGNAASICCGGSSYWYAGAHYCGTAPTPAPTPAPTCGGQDHWLAAWASGDSASICCGGSSYWYAGSHYCGTAPTVAPTPKPTPYPTNAPTCGGQDHYLAAWASGNAASICCGGSSYWYAGVHYCGTDPTRRRRTFFAVRRRRTTYWRRRRTFYDRRRRRTTYWRRRRTFFYDRRRRFFNSRRRFFNDRRRRRWWAAGLREQGVGGRLSGLANETRANQTRAAANNATDEQERVA
jgi:hypothetical protein